MPVDLRDFNKMPSRWEVARMAETIDRQHESCKEVGREAAEMRRILRSLAKAAVWDEHSQQWLLSLQAVEFYGGGLGDFLRAAGEGVEGG